MKKGIIIGIIAILLIIAAVVVFLVIPGKVERNVRSWLDNNPWIPGQYVGKVEYSLLKNSITFDQIDLQSIVNAKFGEHADITASVGTISADGLPIRIILSGEPSELTSEVLGNEVVFNNLSMGVDEDQISFRKLTIIEPRLLIPTEKFQDEDDLLQNIVWGISPKKAMAEGVFMQGDTSEGQVKVNMDYFEYSDKNADDRADIGIKGLNLVLADEVKLVCGYQDLKNIRMVAINEQNEFETVKVRELLQEMGYADFVMVFDSSTLRDLQLFELDGGQSELLFSVKEIKSNITSPMDYGLELSDLVINAPKEDDFVTALGYKDKMTVNGAFSTKKLDTNEYGTNYGQDVSITLEQGGRLDISAIGLVPAGMQLSTDESAYGFYMPNLSGSMLASGKIFYKDESFLDRLLLAVSDGDKDEAEALRWQYIDNSRQAAARMQHEEYTPDGLNATAAADVINKFADFMENPGSIEIAIKMPQPMPIEALAMQMIFASESLLQYVTVVKVEPGPKAAPATTAQPEANPTPPANTTEQSENATGQASDTENKIEQSQESENATAQPQASEKNTTEQPQQSENATGPAQPSDNTTGQPQ